MSAAILTPRARRDVTAAVDWIAGDNIVAARALRDAIAEAAGRLGDHPMLGHVRPELVDAPYRFLTVSGFPYIIVYNAQRHPPLIVRVLHGARDFPDLLRSLE